MASNHYSEFIAEAFINPIRSVLIVDDDYPTLDELLALEIRHGLKGRRPPRGTKAWYDDPKKIKKVIDGFRKPRRPLLVDIHDGSNVKAKGDVKVASHLHQSDLLVLDYVLDKAKPNDGGRAIEILRGLMSNNHFNLVVLHTSEDLNVVFPEIIRGLLAPVGDVLEPAEIEQVDKLIEALEDSGDDELIGKFQSSVGTDQYFYSRRSPVQFTGIMEKGFQPFTQFSEVATAANWDADQRKLVLRHRLTQFEAGILASLRGHPGSELKWSDSAVKWIKSDSVFIAFSSKAKTDDLIDDLQQALEAWNPAPSRLFMAKLRAEMDENGVVAESAAFERNHALAHWYAKLLRAKKDERRGMIAETVGRHSDQLLNSILRNVEIFAGRLVEAEAKVAGENVDAHCHTAFGIDLSAPQSKQKAELEHNAIVCSRPPHGWHLNTGDVFVLEDEYWACLSPACDLVPTQVRKHHENLGGRLPFLAVKLHEVTGKIDVNSNLFVFVDLQEGVKTFCFNDQKKEGRLPYWRMFYAENRGKFGGEFRFKVSYTKAGSRKLVSEKQDAQVVAQLRYEYALNLLQKLGVSLTRIGLDFVAG